MSLLGDRVLRPFLQGVQGMLRTPPGSCLTCAAAAPLELPGLHLCPQTPYSWAPFLFLWLAWHLSTQLLLGECCCR
jgi:hypothetical protein